MPATSVVIGLSAVMCWRIIEACAGECILSVAYCPLEICRTTLGGGTLHISHGENLFTTPQLDSSFYAQSCPPQIISTSQLRYLMSTRQQQDRMILGKTGQCFTTSLLHPTVATDIFRIRPETNYNKPRVNPKCYKAMQMCMNNVS